jgi:hypothetical protein
MVRRVIDAQGVVSPIPDLRLCKARKQFAAFFEDGDPEEILALLADPGNAAIMADYGLSAAVREGFHAWLMLDLPPEPDDPHRTIFDPRQLELKL